MTLLQTKAVVRCTDKQYTKRETPGKRDSFVTAGTVRRVHKLLNSAFTQAMKWELIEKNPAQLATVPKAEKKTRAIWDADTLFHALEVCEDERLKLAINLAFSCSLRVVSCWDLPGTASIFRKEVFRKGRPPYLSIRNCSASERAPWQHWKRRMFSVCSLSIQAVQLRCWSSRSQRH